MPVKRPKCKQTTMAATLVWQRSVRHRKMSNHCGETKMTATNRTTGREQRIEWPGSLCCMADVEKVGWLFCCCVCGYENFKPISWQLAARSVDQKRRISNELQLCLRPRSNCIIVVICFCSFEVLRWVNKHKNEKKNK